MVGPHLELLQYFLLNPGTAYYPAELQLRFGGGRSIYGRLNKLVEAQFLEREKKIYRLNRTFKRRLFHSLRIEAIKNQGDK